MTRAILSLFVCFCLTATLAAEVPNWTFTEEQLRLFNPPIEADAEKMLQWTSALERPIPQDTEPYGGFDKYREQVALMQIMVSRAILATNPPLELEQTAWRTLWFPYYLLTTKNPDEWLPKMKAVYNELTAFSRQQGEVLDELAAFYLDLRGVFFYRICEIDKEFLSYGDEFLGEIEDLINTHRQFHDRSAVWLYSAGDRVLWVMSAVDEKYGQKQAEVRAKQRELILQNEDGIQAPFLYHWLFPNSYSTPEQQAEAYHLIEKFQKLIGANEETERFDAPNVRVFYNLQYNLFTSLVSADIANIPRFQAYLQEIEKKNDPHLNIVLCGGYYTIWKHKLHDFSQNGGSNDDLTLIFDTMMKCLVFGDDDYDRTGWAFLVILHGTSAPFEKCTPEQRKIFIERLEQVIAKMESMENAWKEAGKPMIQESHVIPMRKYLDCLRMWGSVVSLSGATVDGEAFDIEQYRGKVVVLHFWASWCGPCIRQIPGLKELYAQYHDRGFEVLGISYDFEEEKVREFIVRHELPWLSLWDKDNKILNRFSHGNSSLSCLIDREGKAVFYASDEELKAKLAEMF